MGDDYMEIGETGFIAGKDGKLIEKDTGKVIDPSEFTETEEEED